MTTAHGANARRARIVGTGSYLPANVVTNTELSSRVDTSDEWIVERTGIQRRHMAAEGEMTSDLATAAAKRALEAAGIAASEIDLIVLATATPDNTFPASATTVQEKLGVGPCAAFDVQAVCSGFVYGLGVVDAMMRAGGHDKVLLIGAETFSRILDWEDRGTCVLFGDGAGAVVMTAETGGEKGVLSTKLHADGAHKGLLYVDGGPSSTGTVGKLRMSGREVFRHAVKNLASVVGETLDLAGLTAADVDWVVPHQANLRILEATAKKLGMTMSQVIVTVGEHANTSAASVPLALDTAVRDGRIKEDDLLLLEAMGGGFTWGAAAVRW
ncbi:MAG: beta-ketoacyl-ACP synthase III [Pseudomonadota bacterium]